MSAETTGCLVCTKPRQAEVGYLCRNHLDRLAAMLREVEEEAALLSAVPSMAIRTGSGGGSLASTRSPARLDVLVHRDHRRGTGRSETEDDAMAAGSTLPVLDVLHSWARIVREERNYATRGAVTITGERDTLTRALDWCAAQPWIDEMFGDVRQLVGQLKGVNGTQPERPVGRCYLPTETGVCDGPIWVDDAMGHAHCGRCRQTWDGAQLAMLSYELERAQAEAARPKTDDGRRMLTAQELADKWKTSIDNVRKMASRQGIRAVLGHYDEDRFRDKASA